MNVLLTNRQYSLPKAKTWYDPKRFLCKKKSVEEVYLVDTTNSAGDWGGIIIQRLNNRIYFIRFSQTKEWLGFSIITDSNYSCMMSYDEWQKLTADQSNNMDEIISNIFFNEYDNNIRC